MNATGATPRAQLDASVRAALARHGAGISERIRLESDAAGVVTVEGDVVDWTERQRVVEIVAQVPGVTRVDCRLIVDP